MNGTAKTSGVSIDSHFAVPGGADRRRMADGVAGSADAAPVSGMTEDRGG